MILTLTPNPALDRTVMVDILERGKVHRASGVQVDAAGKGVNVTRALTAHGLPSVAVMPVGGRSGTWYLDTLISDGLGVEPIKVTGSLRTNVAVVEPDGTTTKINEPGPMLSDVEQRQLLEAVRIHLTGGATWVVGCGSLAPGTDPAVYADLIELARDLGVRCAIDSSHEPLARAVAAGPHLIKPNLEELEELLGQRLPTVGDVVLAARGLNSAGVDTVLVSLGSRGALVVDANTVAHAHAVVPNPLSTVGAGDALLAGYLSDDYATSVQALATGVAWGAAAVGLPGSQMPSFEHTTAIDVTVTRSPDLDAPTREGTDH
jgi:1-phosphofructokinase family hexose kinase